MLRLAGAGQQVPRAGPGSKRFYRGPLEGDTNPKSHPPSTAVRKEGSREGTQARSVCGLEAAEMQDAGKQAGGQEKRRKEEEGRQDDTREDRRECSENNVSRLSGGKKRLISV